MKELVVILTHVWGEQIKNMCEEISKCRDIILLADIESKNKYNYPNNIDNMNVIFFDKKNHNFNIDSHKSKNVKRRYFFNNFLAIFQIMDEIRKYDRFWMIESDVRYHGDWCDFFKKTDNIQGDLLISNLYTYEQDKNFFWWPNNKQGFDYTNRELYKFSSDKNFNDIPKDKWCHALFCISRISLPLMEMLYQEFPHYNIFFECLVPTLTIYHNFIIKCLNKHPEIMSKSYNWLPVNGFMEDNVIHHACKSIDYEKYNYEQKIYEQIINKYKDNPDCALYIILIKFFYKKFLNKKWINTCNLTKEINEDIKNIIPTLKPGSKQFCQFANYISYLNNISSLNIPKEYIDKFLTDEPVESIGDYFQFLINYTEKYNESKRVAIIIINIMERQVLKLSPFEKKYIEKELRYFHKKNVCERFTTRFLSQIQGIPEPSVQYYQISDDIRHINECIGGLVNYKYYPF